MTTYPQPAHLHRPHVNLSLIAIAGLAAALIGLGAWVIVDRTTGGGGSSATQNATTLVDKLFANLSAGKVDAATALFTPDAVLWQGGETKAKGTAQIHEHATGTLPPGSFTMTRIAPVTVQGNLATTISKINVLSGRAIDVFLLRNGKIAREWDFELGATPPFNNGVPVP